MLVLRAKRSDAIFDLQSHEVEVLQLRDRHQGMLQGHQTLGRLRMAVTELGQSSHQGAHHAPQFGALPLPKGVGL